MGAIEKGPTSPFGFDLINDLSALPDDEDSIVEYLLRRVERGQVYTWVGALLLALNPDNVILSDQYNSLNVEFTNFNEVARKDVIPDIKAIASRAHYQLIQGLGKSCQVIIISGDSGTGKTFNANKALNFLAALNDSSSVLSETPSTRLRELVRKITSACPLISAFSTATTEKNVKSSRHGQLIKLEYKNEVVCGATIRSFLLERSRVTTGYDNFHIFYQLLAGLSENELQKFNLSNKSVYDLIKCDNKIQNVDFKSNFEETIEAMSDLGFTLHERNEIFEVISVLLHLGNIKFKQNYLGGCTINLEDKASSQAVHHVCSAASLDESKLIEFLTTSLISRNSNEKQQIFDHCDLRTTEMCYNRLHSIIRHIYDQLFQQLVNRINTSLSSGFECKTWLGILDIFGFEVFTENKIEQLCINYANERLQLYFMQDYLDSARNAMMEEGIIDFIEAEKTQIHKDRLFVIENHLFPVLIDATQCSAQFNETNLRQRLLDRSTNKFLSLPQSQSFVIQHYSNPVEYSFDNFVTKNFDKVPPELSLMFENSQNSFLNSLKHSMENKTNQNNGKIYAKKCTTLSKVRQSLDQLVKELGKCDSHYVRCVKPSCVNGIWLKDDFKKQLKSIGIFDALSLAKCKFRIRTTYEEFFQRYKFKTTVKLKINNVKNKTALCKSIAEQILSSEVVSQSIHFGSKIIFLTEPIFFQLERFRKKYRNVCAKKIQIFWRSKRKHICDENTNLIKNNVTPENSEINGLKQSKLVDNISSVILNEISGKIFQNDIYQMQKKTFNNLNLSAKVMWNNKMNSISSCNQKPRFKNYQKPTFRNFKINKEAENIIKIISYEGCDFFYKNRIISRQKLAAVPVRFHTRRTCLEESHRLPRSELPQGLIDCL